MANGVGLGGTWAGGLTVRTVNPGGELAFAQDDDRGAERGDDRFVARPGDLAIAGELHGLGDSLGSVAIEGTLARGGDDLAYAATATLAKMHVEHLVTSIAEPVVVDGEIEVSGRGTSLDQIAASGRWRGGPQVLYGQPIDAIDARFALADGHLSLDDASIEGLIGALTVGGDLDLVDGPLQLSVSGPLSPARLAALGAAGLDGRGTIAATIAGDWKSGAPTTIAGTVRYAPFAYGQTLTAATLSAPFAVEAGPDGVVGQITVEGTGLDAVGLNADRLDAAILSLSVRDGTTRISGPLDLTGVRYGDWVTARHASVGLDVVSGSALAVDADIALADYTLASRPGTAGAVRVAMRDDQLRFRAELDDLGRRVLATSGSFDATAADLVLDEIAFAPTPRATWTNAGPARFAFTEGGVAGATLALDSALGHIALSGDLSAAGPLDGELRIAALQLDHIAELYPDLLESAGGTLDATLSFAGTGADPIVDGDLALRGAHLNGQVRWLDAEGHLRIADGAIRPDLAIQVAGDPLGAFTGSAPLSGGLAGLGLDLDRPADLRFTVVPGELERLGRLASALQDQIPEGQLSAVLEVSGGLADPTVHLAGVAAIDVPGWDRQGRTEFDLDVSDSALSVYADLREGLATRAAFGGIATTRIGEVIRAVIEGGEIEGEVPASLPSGEPSLRRVVSLSDPSLYVDDMTASVAAISVPADSLGALAGSDASLGGEIVGGVSITGSPLRPRLEGSFDWLKPRIGTTPLDAAYLSLVPRDDENDDESAYDLDLAVAFPRSAALPDGGHLDAHGVVPVVVDLDRDPETWSKGDLDIAVSGEGVPLSMITAFLPDLRSGEGAVAIQGQIGGPLIDPDPNLLVSIEGGRLTAPDLGVTASGLELVALFADHTLSLEHATAVLAPTQRFTADRFQVSGLAETHRPRVRASGEARLDEWTLGDISALLTLENGAWLSATDTATLRTDGEIRIDGVWPALEVRGGLDVVYGRLDLDGSALADDTPLKLDPSLTVHRTATEAAERTPDAPPLYADFDIDVDVDLKRNLELSMSMPFVDDLGQLGASLSRADISTRLGGHVSVQLQKQQPTLVGALEVVEGKVRVLRSNLALEEGFITFTGGDPYADANLDLTASMSVDGGSLALDIMGSPAAPAFKPRSEAYPDTSEQWTILLTGQSPEDLTSGEAEGAAQALADVFLNSLLAGQSVGTFSIEPDGSVRLGVPITPSIYAASQLSPTSDPSRNALSLELEWSLAPRVVASGGIGDQVQWGDLFWEVRF